MPLSAVITTPHHLDPTDRQALFQLHSRTFANVVRDTFMEDLAAKDWVMLLRDPAGCVVGFSTAKHLVCADTDADRHFLFSGDTVVDRRHWRDSRLAGCFGHLALHLIDALPARQLHWFLISKGYRTYRFLPVFFRTFYPACDRPTPAPVAALLELAARTRFGGAFDPAAGIISFGGARDRLRPDYSDVPPRVQNDPHVRFFLDRNPGFRQGDELACLAPLNRENFNDLAWRMIRRTPVTWMV